MFEVLPRLRWRNADGDRFAIATVEP